MSISRALLLASGGVFSLAGVLATPVAADSDYPNHEIVVVVPYSAGGPPDLLARAVGDHLGQALGQPVIVENKPGANGVVASEFVANAAPDGYTLMIGSLPTHVFNRAMRKLTYDPLEDFSTIALLGYTPTLIAANAKTGLATLGDLLERAREAPGEITYATSGTGSTGHLAAELLQRRTDVELLHIPYDGVSQASLDIVSGVVDVGFSTVNNMLPFIETGEVKPLAITSTKRLEVLADTPAIVETVEDADIELWYGIFGPAGVPDDIVQTLNAEINELLKEPEFIDRWARSATTIAGGTPQEFRDLYEADTAKWQEIIEEAGLTP